MLVFTDNLMTFSLNHFITRCKDFLMNFYFFHSMKERALKNYAGFSKHAISLYSTGMRAIFADSSALFFVRANSYPEICLATVCISCTQCSTAEGFDGLAVIGKNHWRPAVPGDHDRFLFMVKEMLRVYFHLTVA